MLECPFELISCSWPRPVEQHENRWTSEPEWTAPLMPTRPRPYLELIHDEWCWTFNWCDFFRCKLKAEYQLSGEMRGFHVIFCLRMKYGGRLVVRDDDGCIIRRHGHILHCNQRSQQVSRATVEVRAGDLLEVAQWHASKEWAWAAYLCSPEHEAFRQPPNPLDILLPYQGQVQQRLQEPAGPALKLFTNGHVPLRTIIGIYSLILNGYVPSAIYLFGEYQWRKSERQWFKQLLPFAQIVPVSQVLRRLQALGGSALVELAVKHWFVMKTAIALLYPPEEFCLMDDDVLVLQRLDEPLEAFRTHNLVYITNYDHSDDYIETWGEVYKDVPRQLPTGSLNAGLYWLRNGKDPQVLAAHALQAPPTPMPQNWEQGLIAVAYADEPSIALPAQRYFAPALDGFPGGSLDYDYAHNPCGFATIHFAGCNKPTDGQALYLVPQLLKAGTLQPDPPVNRLVSP